MAHHAHFGAPVVPPSLPLWVSKLPELVAARKYPLHTWARQALRSAVFRMLVSCFALVGFTSRSSSRVLSPMIIPP